MTGSPLSAKKQRARAAVAGPKPGSRSRTRTLPRGHADSREAKQRKDVLDVRGIKKYFSPPNLTKGMLRRVSSNSSGPLRCDAQTELLWPSAPCRSRDCRAPSLRHSAPGRLHHDAPSPAEAAPLPASDQRFLVKRSDARSITALAAARIGCVER